MAHVSGNPEWKQYPSTATRVDAVDLENIENTLDGFDTGKASTSHADTHATGGSDPVSPESIGALMDEGVTLLEGESLDNLVEGGTYVRVSPANNTVALRYPVDGWAGFIQVLPSTNPNYVLQRAYSLMTVYGATAYRRNSWYRTKYAEDWGPWVKDVTDDDPRLLNTGWRVLSSWGTDGVVTGDPLPQHASPRAGFAGSVSVRREGYQVTFRLKGIEVTSVASFPLPSGFTSEPCRRAVATDSGVVSFSARSSVYVSPCVVDEYAAEAVYRARHSFPSEPYPGTPG